MKFGDFTNTNFVIFFSIIIALVVLIILVILFFAISVKNDRNFEKQVDYESTTTRIYIIDVKKNKIVQLNKSDMGNKITYDLFSFYTSFHPNDSERVKNWIFQICVNPKTAGEYLEADILLNNSKKLCFTLLRLLDYNPQTGLIHLESHILKYITPNNAPKKKNDNRTPTGIVKRSQIQSIINHNKSLSGYSFCIRFFYTRQKIISNDKIERYMIMNLKNTIYPYASNPKLPRQILDNGDSELFIFDLRLSNRESAMQLANSISVSIKKQMEVNGFSGFINFAIGIVENGQFYQNYDMIEEKVRDSVSNCLVEPIELIRKIRKQCQHNAPVVERHLVDNKVDGLLRHNPLFLLEFLIRIPFRRVLRIEHQNLVHPKFRSRPRHFGKAFRLQTKHSRVTLPFRNLRNFTCDQVIEASLGPGQSGSDAASARLEHRLSGARTFELLLNI